MRTLLAATATILAAVGLTALGAVLARLDPGQSVKVVVRDQGGSRKNLRVTLGEYPRRLRPRTADASGHEPFCGAGYRARRLLAHVRSLPAPPRGVGLSSSVLRSRGQTDPDS